MKSFADNIFKFMRIPISQAVPGMVLARDIYTSCDQLVLTQGTVLDSATITKIMFYAIGTIAVYPLETGEKLDHEPASFTNIRNSMEFREFSIRYDQALVGVQGLISRIINGEMDLGERELIEEVDEISNKCLSRSNVFHLMRCIRDYDELTYMHSLNVSIICSIFADWLSLKESEKKILILCGLLHDIGKTMVDINILKKPESLTAEEYNVIKNHTIYGYELLMHINVDERVKLTALQHHERYDSSGYPLGCSGKEVEPFAMVVAIADVYDAMVCDRVHRNRISPFKVIHNLELDDRGKFEPHYLIPLLEHIAHVYIHQAVRLSDDKIGVVALINNSELSRPVIKVDGEIIDLTKRRDLVILDVL